MGKESQETIDWKEIAMCFLPVGLFSEPLKSKKNEHIRTRFCLLLSNLRKRERAFRSFSSI
jgi:hypothetical protein